MALSTPLILAIAVVVLVIVAAVAFIYSPTPINTTTTISSDFNSSLNGSSTTIPGTSTISTQGYSFNLSNCAALPFYDQVYLTCKYSSSINFTSWGVANITFIGPSGNLTLLYGNLGTSTFSLHSNNTMRLAMADYWGTPLPGRYTVAVSYQGQSLLNEDFTFSGANLTVVSAAPSGFTDSGIPNPSGSGHESYIGTINVTVYNSGDLPVYINLTKVGISGPVSHNIGDSYIYWMLPHHHYSSPAATPYAYPSGSYTINVSLLNYSNVPVAEASFPIQTP
ncbi:MAG TPA: hypothetical protein VNF06_02650 [Candidatus Aquilonibacter sp.]|nr:hypothetical protein [Candidatus Aquilonibacter sp.]